MITQNDLTDLDQELAHIRTALDSWASAKQNAAEHMRDTHAQRMQDQADKFEELQQQQQHLVVAVKELQQRLHTEEDQLNTLQATSSSLRSEQQTAAKRLGLLEEAAAAQEEDCLRKETDASRAEQRSARKIGALRKALTMYASRLGLEFRHGADNLQLVMTQIQASNPEKEFVVSVRVLPDNTYQVTKCAPEVEQLPALLAQLNATNSFSDFVKALRTQFQLLANSK